MDEKEQLISELTALKTGFKEFKLYLPTDKEGMNESIPDEEISETKVNENGESSAYNDDDLSLTDEIKEEQAATRIAPPPTLKKRRR